MMPPSGVHIGVYMAWWSAMRARSFVTNPWLRGRAHGPGGAHRNRHGDLAGERVADHPDRRDRGRAGGQPVVDEHGRPVPKIRLRPRLAVGEPAPGNLGDLKDDLVAEVVIRDVEGA